MGHYWSRLSLEDFEYLNEHEHGLKCWQTDYKLLRNLRTEMYLAGLKDYKRDIAEYNNQKDSLEVQKPLFPENS